MTDWDAIHDAAMREWDDMQEDDLRREQDELDGIEADRAYEGDRDDALIAELEAGE